MKRWLITGWLTFLLTISFAFFWYNQLVYSLPTPIPAKYKNIPAGKKLLLNDKFRFKNDRPVFLHFFNPDCPCSRFNIDHFKSLVRDYHSDINFAIVLMSSKSYSEKEIQQRFNVIVPVITDLAVAEICGVYSTPQAVIISQDHKLYYRGNYNKTRYCTDAKSSYAKIALEDLLHHKSLTQLDQFALKAYGCTLPGCKN